MIFLILLTLMSKLIVWSRNEKQTDQIPICSSNTIIL